VAPGSFTHDVLEKLSAADRSDEKRIIALLAVLAEGIAKMFPIDYESYGVSARDRLGEHPLRQQVLELAAAFGVTEIDVYLHRSPTTDVVAEVSQPPALMVPQHVADAKESERVFLLARPLSLVARGLHPALTLGARELGRLIAASMQSVAPGYGQERYGMEDLTQVNKRLMKALSRRARKALEGVVQPFIEDPRVDVERWIASVPLSSTRVAAILANDLPAAALAVKRTSGERADGAALVQRSALVADLLRLWPSELAFDVRRATGVL
jgi:hypothetical protein